MSSDQSVPHSNPSNVTLILLLCSKVTMDGTNYNDWIRNIKMALRFEHKEYVLETELVEVDPNTATPEEIAACTKHSYDATKVTFIMIATMNPELQRIYEDYWPYEMHKELVEKFRKQERIESREVVKAFINGKPKDGESICTHVQRMHGYMERFRKLEMTVHEDLAVDIVLNSLPSSYVQFTLAYHLNNNQATLAKLHRMLRTAEDGMKGKGLSLSTRLSWLLALARERNGRALRRKTGGKRLMSGHLAVPREPSLPAFHTSRIPKKLTVFTVRKRVTGREAAPGICKTSRMAKRSHHKQGLKKSRELEHGRLNMVMGNRRTSPVTKIEVYRLVLSSGVVLDLHNCCYSPDMAKNIISFHALFKQGFYYEFNKLNGSTSVFKNDVFIFNAMPCDGVYEFMCVDNYGKHVLAIDSSSGIEKVCLWHCRLGHMNKKRIAQLQKDGVLESFDLGSDDVCESCLLGKMTKSPFKGSFERGEGLLDIIHTDVCGPFRTTTKDGTRFYVTFTDDFSRYGYIYLIKNKSDRGGEFLVSSFSITSRNVELFHSYRLQEHLS
ncbi:hypothetical protein L2E82_35813 [Cichorium intybus]|uniref:Uncharacterized protein n=1 Tax=Cichorium intybus TaxID=13427 RepID=A0ACB9BPT0_CICIN|nr:hypothetical protein L2E82_35813 [Cichorium intybus]